MNTTLPGKKRINYKAVLALLAILVLLGVGVHFVHAFQVKRNAANLREQATVVEKEGKLNEARDFWSQYVGMMPEDTEGLVQYGTLLDKMGPAARLKAFAVLENVLRREPQRQDIRRRVAEIAMELRYFSDAKVHLLILHDREPSDVDVLHRLGKCAMKERKFAEAFDWYDKAQEKGTKHLDVYVDYAKNLREAQEDTKADGKIRKMVIDNPADSQARIKAADYFTRYKDWEEAEKYARAAIEDLHSQEPDAFLLASRAAFFAGKKKEAADYLARGEKLHPNNTQLAQWHVFKDLFSGDAKQALKNFDKGPLKAAEKGDNPEVTATPEDLIRVTELLMDLGEPQRAQEVLKRYRDKGNKVAADFLQARLAMQLGNWAEAKGLLEDIRKQRIRNPGLLQHTNLLLAKCYDKLGNLDLEYQACTEALVSDKQWLPGHQALASCLAAMGKTEEAIQEYRLLVQWQVPGARLQMGRLLVARNLRLPPAEQDWAGVDQLLQAIPAGQPGDASVELLRADIFIAQKKYDEARPLIEAARNRDPKQLAPWARLVMLAELDGNVEKTRQLLDEAERATNKQVDWTLARLRIDYHSEKPAEFKKLLAETEKAQGQYAEADRPRLLAGLAEGYVLVGDRQAALRLWQEVAERLPQDTGVRFRLFEAAIGLKQEAEARRWLDQIKRIEGPGGAMSEYGEAAILVMRAEKGDKAILAEARKHLTEAARQRPSWSRVPLLEAVILEMDHQKDRALDKFKVALDRGETRPFILQHVVRLYYEKGRYTEAHALLNRLPVETVTGAGLKRMAAELDLLDPATNKNQDPSATRARALDMARKAVKEKKADYEDYLWLGLVAAAAEQPDEAEKALRQARAMKPESAETWAALVTLLARTNAQQAEVELRNAMTALPPDQSPLVLAVGYEMLGKMSLADENYQAALKTQPNNLALLRNAANFYRRNNQPAKAIDLLKKVLDPGSGASEPTTAWARRSLALSLSGGGNYRQFLEAQALLDRNTKEFGDSDEDRRTRALVLASQPQYRSEAIKAFERLSVKEDLSPETKFFLAQLYDADGNWRTARGLLQVLVRDHENNPAFLASLASLLLRHKEADEALPHIEKLVKLRPKSYQAVALHVWALKEKGKTELAGTLVRNFAGSGGPPEQAAQLFEDLGEKLDAEKYFRAYVAAGPDHPERTLVLAAFLGRVSRLEEALALCDQAWEKCMPEAVGFTSVALIRLGQASDAQERHVESRLREAIAKNPAKSNLVQLRADFLDLCGRSDEAIDLYREIVKAQPNNVAALNNLAVALALRERQLDEALGLINAAIQIAGSNPQLLDTRAMVYLSQHHPELALKDLEEAIRQSPLPLFYFHQARAYAMGSDRRLAIQCWQKATQDGGLTASGLPRPERRTFEALSRQISGS